MEPWSKKRLNQDSHSDSDSDKKEENQTARESDFKKDTELSSMKNQTHGIKKFSFNLTSNVFGIKKTKSPAAKLRISLDKVEKDNKPKILSKRKKSKLKKKKKALDV